MVGVGALEEATRRPRVASGGKHRREDEVSSCYTIFGPISIAVRMPGAVSFRFCFPFLSTSHIRCSSFVQRPALTVVPNADAALAGRP